MRTLPFLQTRLNVRPLLGCLAIFTALSLLNLPITRQSTASSPQDETVKVPQTTFPGTGVGAIPDGLSGTPPMYGAPLTISFPVSGITAPLTSVSLSLTLTHSWVGDVEVLLTAPGGAANLVLVSRIGVQTAGSFGDSSNYGGTYTFTDAVVGTNIWTVATSGACGDACAVTNDSYRTTQAGIVGQANPPPVTSLNSTFSGLGAGANGTWTLTLRDAAQSDTGSVTAASLTLLQIGSPQKPPLDFDGDNKTDYAVTRPVAGIVNWYLQRSTAGFLGQPWGTSPGDRSVPGDYDGDGKWDIAIWRPGTPSNFYILGSLTGALQVVAFGTTGDDPRITQDFDGDGKADPAVTRDVGGTLTWYIQRSTFGFLTFPFGRSSSDVGIRGDWDGDGKADAAVYRYATGTFDDNTFFVHRSSDGGDRQATFGTSSTDYIVPADFDGDGKTDYAVWRGIGAGTSGAWYWLQSSDGAFRFLFFGTGNLDVPVPGDYDGDGKTDQAVWRVGFPANFYVNRSTAGFVGLPFGQAGDSVPGFGLQVR